MLINDLLVAFHYAMLTHIKPNFRLLCIDWSGNDWIKLRAYSDSPVNDEDYEMLACIYTDLDQDIIFKEYYKEVEYATAPLHELDSLKLILYARHEE